jgi:hypothetical protein
MTGVMQKWYVSSNAWFYTLSFGNVQLAKGQDAPQLSSCSFDSWPFLQHDSLPPSIKLKFALSVFEIIIHLASRFAMHEVI